MLAGGGNIPVTTEAILPTATSTTNIINVPNLLHATKWYQLPWVWIVIALVILVAVFVIIKIRK